MKKEIKTILITVTVLTLVSLAMCIFGIHSHASSDILTKSLTTDHCLQNEYLSIGNFGFAISVCRFREKGHMSKSVYVRVFHDLELLRYVLCCAIERQL